MLYIVNDRSEIQLTQTLICVCFKKGSVLYIVNDRSEIQLTQI